jgi:hypothetical protein
MTTYVTWQESPPMEFVACCFRPDWRRLANSESDDVFDDEYSLAHQTYEAPRPEPASFFGFPVEVRQNFDGKSTLFKTTSTGNYTRAWRSASRSGANQHLLAKDLDW